MALKESDSGLHRLGQIQMAQLDIQIWSDSSGLDKNGIEYFQTRVVLTLGSMVFWLSEMTSWPEVDCRTPRSTGRRPTQM